MFCRCQIIDFHKPTGPMGTHPRLFEWILHYYSADNGGGAKVVCTSKPPIYLQHQGQCHNVLLSYYSLSLFMYCSSEQHFLVCLCWIEGLVLFLVIFLFHKNNVKVCIFIGWKSWMWLGFQPFDMYSYNCLLKFWVMPPLIWKSVISNKVVNGIYVFLNYWNSCVDNRSQSYCCWNRGEEEQKLMFATVWPRMFFPTNAETAETKQWWNWSQTTSEICG